MLLFPNSTLSPLLINICDYIGGQAFQYKRLIFFPINYPPPQTQNEMSSSILTNLCKGWMRLCRDLLVAGLEHGNPLVYNGSQKSNTNNRVFKCGVLYRSMRPSRAMEVFDKNPLQDTTLINDRKNNREDGIHGPKRIKMIDQRDCTCSFKFMVKWQIRVGFFIELEKYAGESFHCFHPKILDTSTIPYPSRLLTSEQIENTLHVVNANASLGAGRNFLCLSIGKFISLVKFSYLSQKASGKKSVTQQ
jgi:hypothetical protein